MKNKKKLWIIIIIIIAALLLIGGGTTAIIVSNSQVNDGGKKEWTIDDNQTFTYSGEEIAPKVSNLDENEKAKVVYSYSEKKDENPIDDTYTTGLPKDAGTYYVKAALENDYKITTITIEPAEVKLEDIQVVYNQPFVSGNYFTSEMNIDQMEFEYEFTSSGTIVSGDVSLTSTFLSPSIKSYDYTFIPNDKNYKNYNGTIDIEVYAIVYLYNGDQVLDYLEVPFNSSFDYELTQKLGYDMPYFVDDNNNKFELGTKITGDLKLHYIENPINYSITYHLDGGINGDNPISYNIKDEPIYLNDASKEGYLFKGWFEDPNFNYDSLVTTIDPSHTLKSYQLYASFEWIKINPAVEFEPLVLVYNGESQELVMANVEGGTITYSLDGVNYSANVPTATNAGVYNVYYKIKGDSQHLNTEGNFDVTISKAVYDMSQISLVDKTVTYNGNEQGIEITGVLPSDVTVAYSGMGTNVGEYIITAVFSGDENNYEAISNMSATLTIQKANLEYTLPIGKNLVFNDANQELVIPGSISLGTILYSLDDENYSEEIPAGKNIGNYVVYYKYDINNENYNDIPSGYVQSFISKGEVVYTLPTPKELTYNGLAQELISAGSINVGSVEYSLDGIAYSENIPTATNAGSYIVYYRFVYDKTNYNQVEDGNFITIIAKANPTLVAPTAKELTYTGSALVLINAGSVNAGTLVYSLDGENYTEELPQATNAGSYTVYYKVNGNDNYNDIAAETLEVTIAKATYDMSQITMTDSTVTYDGLAHGIEITGVLPTGVTVEYSGLGTNAGTYTIVATFTGDATNYEAIPNMSATLTIEKADALLVAPTAKTLTYTGSALVLINAGSTNAEAVEYSLDDANYSIDVPTAINAGDYTIYYRVVGGQNYKDIAASSIAVTINKANVSKVNPKLRNLIYIGEELELAIAGSISVGLVEYSLDGIVYSENIPTATNAGSYIVYYRFVYDKTNYNQVEDGNFITIIAKANPTLVAPTVKELTYTGSALVLFNAGSVNAGTLVYSLDGENYTDELPQATNAGSYTVYYKVNGNDNYNDIAAETLEVTIAKATYDMSQITMTDSTVTYDGLAHGIEITGVLPTGVTVEYSGLGTNAGTYTIVATFTGDATNYEAIPNMSATLTITKAFVTFTNPTAKTGLVYSGSSQALVNAGSISAGSIEYSTNGINYTNEIPAMINAGTYTVYYRYEVDSVNYDTTGLSDSNIEVTIAKATYDMSGVSFNDASKTYTGSAQSLVITGELPEGVTASYTGSGINVGLYEIEVSFTGDATNYEAIPNMSATLTITKATYDMSGVSFANATKVYNGSAQSLTISGSLPEGVSVEYSGSGINVGTYTIVATFTGDATNYEAIPNMSATLTITKASVNYTLPTAKTGLVYNTEAQVLVNAGSVSVGQIEYSLDNVTYSTSIPTGTDVATYTVYYRFVVDSTNYDITELVDSSVEVTINKPVATLVAPTAKTGLVYNETSQTLINAGSTSVGTIEYSLDNSNFQIALPKATNAGNYTVYYRFNVDTENYDTQGVATTGSFGVTISKVTLAHTNPTSKTGLVYSGSSHALVNAGSIDKGTIEYSLDNSSYSTSIPTGINAGAYTVYYRFTYDTINYATISNGSVQVTIAKANPTYTIPTGLNATPSMTLGDVELPSGFTFNDSLETNVGPEGDNVFVVTYTPTDTANYNVINDIQVTIQVSALIRLVINAENNQATTYNSSEQAPNVTVKAGSTAITSGYTLSYSYKLSSATSYTTGLPTNAGTYSIKINCTGEGYADANEVVVIYVINKATLTITSSTIGINYDSTSRTQALVFTSIANAITYTGNMGSDSITFTISGMHNGKYKYGTVSGSYVAPTSDTIFGSKYTNVIGSTYIAYFTCSNTNYVLSTDNAIVKYKTAKIGSTYYTIEDALATTGTITFAGDSTSAQTYVATTFTSLDTSITGYQTAYTISNRTMVVPYKNQATVKTEPDFVETGSQTYVYSSLIIPNHISLTLTGQSTLMIDADTIYSQGSSSTWANVRGVIVNDGTIRFNGSKLYAWGYLKGEGNVYFENSSEAYDLLDLFDFSGGTIASNISSKCLPFTAWTLNNISCKAYYYSSSTLSGYSHAKLSIVGHVSGTAMIIGKSSSSNALFLPASTSTSNYIVKYGSPSISNTATDTTALRSIVGNNQLKGIKQMVEIYGNYIDSVVSISINVTIKTSTSISLPISYMDIILKEGTTLNLSNSDYLFLPGTCLEIREGARLNASSGVDIVFMRWNYFQSGYNFFTNCVDKVDAYCNNAGSISSQGKIGGLVVADGEDATVDLTGDVNASYTMYYRTGAEPYYETKTVQLKMYLYSGVDEGNVLKLIENKGSFHGIIDNKGIFGYYATTAVLSYNLNGGSGNNSSKSITIGVEGYTLSSSDLPSTNPTKQYYVFDGWYVDTLFTIPAIGYTTYSGLTLNAKWNPVEYNINYEDKYKNNFTSGNTSTNNNPSTFNYETLTGINDAINGEYVFAGWYVDSSCNTKINMIDGHTLVNYLSNNAITLYALWYKNGTDKYVVNYINSNADITCPMSDIIIDEQENWDSYHLPVMNGNDNDYTVNIYFDGWYNGNSKITNLTKSDFVLNPDTGDYEITLTAVWNNKNVLEITVLEEHYQTVYYKPGFSFTIPSLDSSITFGNLGMVFINWIFDGTDEYNSGDVVTLTNQATLSPNLLHFVKIKIGANDYTTVTVQLTAGKGYIVNYNDETGVSSATAFSGTTISNDETIYVTQGSSFQAKYAYSGNKDDGKATITNTTPTTNLTTSYTTYTVTGVNDVVITPSGSNSSSGTCLLPTSLVMLADGTEKMAKDLTMDDEILSFNHITGKFEASKISFNVVVDYHWFDVIILTFENGKQIELATGHGFFNMTTNRYEIYYGHEFEAHIGEVFATVEYVDGEFVIAPSKLVNVVVEKRYTQKVSPVSEYNINCIADGILTIPDDIEGMFDAFVFNSDLTIDIEAFQEDIMNYGLITYEEVSDVVPEYLFDTVNFQYFKIFIAKGYLSVDKVNHWIEAYLPYIIEQHNLDFDFENRVPLTNELLGLE